MARRQRHQSPRPATNRRRPNSKRSRPSGNSASTGISPVPPIRQATRGLTNDRQHTPHLDAGTTTASARTKHPVNVRTGQPHPAANPPSSCCVGAVIRPMQSWDAATAADCRIGSTRIKTALRAASPLRVSSLRCGPLRGGRDESALREGRGQLAEYFGFAWLGADSVPNPPTASCSWSVRHPLDAGACNA